jgi:hypothetical protein
VKNKVLLVAVDVAVAVLLLLVLFAIIGWGLQATGIWPNGPHPFETQGCSNG